MKLRHSLLALMTPIIISSCSNETEKVISMHATLAKTNPGLSNDYVPDLQYKYSKGNWLVYTPVENPNEQIMILRKIDGEARIIAIASEDNVAVFQNNRPVSYAYDENKDGFFESYSRELYDKHGQLLRITIDHNSDGFPDTFADMTEGARYAQIDNNWLKIESQSSNEFVRIKDEYIQIVKTDKGWEYANEKSLNKN
jgi:hypothetical protein